MAKTTKSNLQTIPGIGKRISEDFRHIGIWHINDLKGKNPEKLYKKSNKYEGAVQDRCLLYTYRYAVYFAEHKKLDPKKSRWWNWKDKNAKIKGRKLK